jgi:hypothetical protein
MLGLACTKYVEMSAVMAKYNPFAEKAGMAKVVVQEPPKEALKVLQMLEKLGFNRELLGSSRHIAETLGGLPQSQVAELKSMFARFRHTRFSKSFSYHLPYGTVEMYRRQIHGASLEKLAVLIKICGFLLQSKAYLFWRQDKCLRNDDPARAVR